MAKKTIILDKKGDKMEFKKNMETIKGLIKNKE